MNILYISYSCDPFNGSEDQIGWNIPITSESFGNRVYVITKEEHRKNINKYLINNSHIKIEFYFIDVPRIYKIIFKGLAYSMRIILWQKRAFKLAKILSQNKNIQIIHQVAPVEIRALGNYGKIKNVLFVAGPVGGGFPIPKPLNTYAKKYFFTEKIRRFFNIITFLKLYISKKIERCDYILFTNEETKSMLDKFHIRIPDEKWEYHCDVGIDYKSLEVFTQIDDTKEVVFLVPGRLNYRKGHQLLFDSIPRNINFNFKFSFRIVGSGPLEKHLKKVVKNDVFLNKHITFVGKIPFIAMENEYRNCTIVVLSSLSEATGTVLIEGIAKSKPIITSNHFGAKILLNDSCAWLFEGKSKQELISDFRRCILESIYDINVTKTKSMKAFEYAQKYTWNAKVLHFESIYNQIMNKSKNEI